MKAFSYILSYPIHLCIRYTNTCITYVSTVESRDDIFHYYYVSFLVDENSRLFQHFHFSIFILFTVVSIQRRKQMFYS